MLIYNCPELFQQQDKKGGIKGMKEPKPVDFNEYRLLHREGKFLIRSWFERAWQARKSENVFEPFIFAWFAFNGWGTCVTNTDTDADMIDSLIADRRMNDDFNDLVNTPESTVSTNAKILLSFLPIFDVKELKKLNLLYGNQGKSRREIIDNYLTGGAIKFEPRCRNNHLSIGENIPLDWAHILRAIYKVRCNLFHGQKSAHSEMDKQIVSAAFQTLTYFLERGRYLKR